MIVGKTATVIRFDVAGFPVTHESDDITTQETMSPSTNEDDVNVELLVPTLLPLTCH